MDGQMDGQKDGKMEQNSWNPATRKGSNNSLSFTFKNLKVLVVF